MNSRVLMSLEIILFNEGLRLCLRILEKEVKKIKASSVLAETVVHLQHKLLYPLTQNVCCDTT